MPQLTRDCLLYRNLLSAVQNCLMENQGLKPLSSLHGVLWFKRNPSFTRELTELQHPVSGSLKMMFVRQKK